MISVRSIRLLACIGLILALLGAGGLSWWRFGVPSAATLYEVANDLPDGPRRADPFLDLRLWGRRHRIIGCVLWTPLIGGQRPRTILAVFVEMPGFVIADDCRWKSAIRSSERLRQMTHVSAQECETATRRTGPFLQRNVVSQRANAE